MNKILIILAGFLVVGALVGTGFFMHKRNMAEQKQVQQNAEAVVAQVRKAGKLEMQKQAALRDEFEMFLKQFTDQLQVDMQKYKATRNVLNALEDTDNLVRPDYIDGNADLAESTVLSLEESAAEIMMRFEKADNRSQDLIPQFKDVQEQENIRTSWAKVRDENMKLMRAFFTMDQEILNAQLELIEFYRTNKDVMDIDENGDIVFMQDSIGQRAQVLKDSIEELRKMQKLAMDASKPLPDDNH